MVFGPPNTSHSNTTIPLAEEDINPGLKLMGALEDFNACLATEGYSWIGFPNADLGANDPVNQPGYLETLQLCNSRTSISNAYQDFQTSRTDLAPDVVRQENEDFIDLADCLRAKGWDIGEEQALLREPPHVERFRLVQEPPRRSEQQLRTRRGADVRRPPVAARCPPRPPPNLARAGPLTTSIPASPSRQDGGPFA